MKRLFYIILLAVYILAGCSPLALAPSSVQPALPFTLVTAAPNASPTPTPFQPIPWTPTGTLQSQPSGDTATPSATLPAATQTEIPTIDPNLLVNTVVPFSTIDPAGSQILNNGQETVNFLLIGSDRRPGGSFRTDTMVIAILAFVWLTPPGWLGDPTSSAPGLIGLLLR